MLPAGVEVRGLGDLLCVENRGIARHPVGRRMAGIPLWLRIPGNENVCPAGMFPFTAILSEFVPEVTAALRDRLHSEQRIEGHRDSRDQVQLNNTRNWPL